MKHIKIFEEHNPNITDVINKLIAEYKEEFDVTPYQINDGFCEDFASDVITEMGGYRDNLFEMGFDNICNIREPEFALENWDGELIETEYGVWAKTALEMYGYPPVDLELIDDEINHVWIYYKGKCYDAEAPEGVDTWADLPLCKKFFKNYK